MDVREVRCRLISIAFAFFCAGMGMGAVTVRMLDAHRDAPMNTDAGRWMPAASEAVRFGYHQRRADRVAPDTCDVADAPVYRDPDAMALDGSGRLYNRAAQDSRFTFCATECQPDVGPLEPLCILCPEFPRFHRTPDDLMAIIN